MVTEQKVIGSTGRAQALRRITKAVHALLKVERNEAALEQALRIVGTEAGCDRVCVFEGGAIASSLRVRAYWSHERNVCRNVGALFRQTAAAPWLEQLQAGQVVQVHDDASPPEARAVLEAQEVHTLLMLPINGPGDRWGGLRLDACRHPYRWTPHEQAALRKLAQELGGMVLYPLEDDVMGSSEKRSRSGAVLSRVDQVLVEVARLLVSDRDFRPEELLERVGESLEAAHVYLVTLPPDLSITDEQAAGERPRPSGEHPWPDFETYTYHEWYARQEPLVEDSGSALAVPILSQGGMLYGYLGIDHDSLSAGCPKRDRQVLYALGDMLSTYLERHWAEAALRESQKRYRAFVNAIIEGVWAVEVDPPVDTECSFEEQFQAIRNRAVLAVCNEPMARVLGVDTPAEVIGKPVAEITPDGLFDSFFNDFLAFDYNLRNREYGLHSKDEPVRHFRVNALGTIEAGTLVRIWGSWTDVTERVELERRMVTALEQQQQRIGRELHDGVGQLLTGISMLGQNMLDRHFREGEEGYERTKKILRFTREATRLVRELQSGLTPVQAHHDGEVVEALSMLVGSTDGLSGIACTFRHDGRAQVEEREVGFQVYRIAQEATNNALKHAAPSTIEISFILEGNSPVLQVHDDGCGFDPSLQQDQSLGLESMRYRARSIGAGFSIESSLGTGTTVRCVLSHSL